MVTTRSSERRKETEVVKRSSSGTPSSNDVDTAPPAARAARFSIDPSLVRSPDVAWPTLALCVGAIAAHVTLAASSDLWDASKPMQIAALICTQAVFAYALFTPAHDATHRSVSRRFRALNELVGWVSTVALAAPFGALRMVHLQHHKHTNDGSKDPDMWSQSGPRWALPLRWMTQVEHYYAVYIFKGGWRAAGAPMAAATVTFVVALHALVFASASALATGSAVGFVSVEAASVVIWRWWIPARIASACLAYSFDYVPHRPGSAKAATDPFGATRLIRGVSPGFLPSLDLLVPLFGQSDHVVHHLWPSIPFYRYRETYSRYKEQFEAREVRTTFIEPATPWL